MFSSVVRPGHVFPYRLLAPGSPDTYPSRKKTGNPDIAGTVNQPEQVKKMDGINSVFCIDGYDTDIRRGIAEINRYTLVGLAGYLADTGIRDGGVCSQFGIL